MMYHLGLIGYPIKHSLSPWIHEQLLKKAMLQGDYRLFELSLEQSFAKQAEHIKQQNVHGFNVTVPFKETIIPYLDNLSSEAQAIGAVNTVVNQNGRWIGYNTDGIGYLRALESQHPHVFMNKTNPVLIIGAGGAARGIYYALLSEGFRRIDIANRTIEKAYAIAALNTYNARTDCITLEQAEKRLEQYALIIQTTSVGMKPNNKATPLYLNQIKPRTIVSDIVYQPLETLFLKEAVKRQALVHYGHTMLLYQAQAAFEIWTNQRVSIDNLDLKLQTRLEGNQC